MLINESSKSPWLSISVRRGPTTGNLKTNIGLIVTVKAEPIIEEFMKTASLGNTINISEFGVDWCSLNSEPLEIYDIAENAALHLDNSNFTIFAPNRKLLLGGDLRDEGEIDFIDKRNPNSRMVNLSFLRFAGISKPDGVSFGVTGAHSKLFIQEFATKSIKAAKYLVEEYIVPINLNVRLIAHSTM
jgi:hypothetical protein